MWATTSYYTSSALEQMQHHPGPLILLFSELLQCISDKERVSMWRATIRITRRAMLKGEKNKSTNFHHFRCTLTLYIIVKFLYVCVCVVQRNACARPLAASCKRNSFLLIYGPPSHWCTLHYRYLEHPHVPALYTKTFPLPQHTI